MSKLSSIRSRTLQDQSEDGERKFSFLDDQNKTKTNMSGVVAKRNRRNRKVGERSKLSEKRKS